CGQRAALLLQIGEYRSEEEPAPIRHEPEQVVRRHRRDAQRRQSCCQKPVVHAQPSGSSGSSGNCHESTGTIIWSTTSAASRCAQSLSSPTATRSLTYS